MNIPAFNDPYSLLARFLSPWKDAETVEALSQTAMRANVDDWGPLLYMANVQLCSPLWFVRLRGDGLLSLLPQDLQTYLLQLYQQNEVRNREIQNSLREILCCLRDQEVPTVLLKGAASLVDDLFRDSGARMLADIDILVKTQQLEAVKAALAGLGYLEQPDAFTGSIGSFESYRPHHLPPFINVSGTVVVELHFELGRGQAGRVLPSQTAWSHCKRVTWEGLSVSLLAPTYRLVHNTVHALVPGQQMVNSFVQLSQLVEFAYLVRRNASEIDWQKWLEMGHRQGLGRAFRIYLAWANGLLNMPFPQAFSPPACSALHCARVAVKANVTVRLSGQAGAPPSHRMSDRAKEFAVLAIAIFYREMTLPVWEWRNRFYRTGYRHIPIRFFCLTRFLCGFYLSKVLDIRRIWLRFYRGLLMPKKPS